MIDHCFQEQHFEVLWCDCFVDNPASERVMHKCGFHDTGAFILCSHLFPLLVGILVLLVDGIIGFQSLVDYFGSYALVEIMLLRWVVLPILAVYIFVKENICN